MDAHHRDAIARYLDILRAAIDRTSDRILQAQASVALTDLRRAYDAAITDEIDRAFGDGWRHGRDVGTDEGWEQRDAIARSELKDEQARTQAVQAQLEAARAELADPIGQYQQEVEGTLQRRRQKRATRSTGVH